MPGLPGVMAPPKTMSRFVTKPSIPKPVMALPKAAAPKIAAPKAGRLTPTGGRAPGVPGAKAPRIPKPVMAKSAYTPTARRLVLMTPKGKVLRGKPAFKRAKGHFMPVGGDFLKAGR
jgi:hypothetical protein